MLIQTLCHRSLTWDHLWANSHNAQSLKQLEAGGHKDVEKQNNISDCVVLDHNKPMSSGSGSESGNCAEISCLSVDTRYLPGWTSPGSASGNWKTDFGLSHSLRERCHAEMSISLYKSEDRTPYFWSNRRNLCHFARTFFSTLHIMLDNHAIKTSCLDINYIK